MEKEYVITSEKEDMLNTINELNTHLKDKETQEDTNEICFVVPSLSGESVSFTYNNVEELKLNDAKNFSGEMHYEIGIYNSSNVMIGDFSIDDDKILSLVTMAYTDESERPPFRVVYQFEIIEQ